ncbi:hypothetical protein CDAR_300071 [Caerostris darwini]|uniref:Uncharacterized protein n=1 Tax=Caerostris darwini TaxID=1538125 RepID=A0AAV4W415_9ARAC|nr:hypothetical protein CDAR_300071 [Caerostris darwini]
MDENTNKKQPLGLRRHLTSARDMAADNVSIERRPQKKKEEIELRLCVPPDLLRTDPGDTRRRGKIHCCHPSFDD